MYGKTQWHTLLDEIVLPHLRLGPYPASYTFFIDREGLVRYHQILIDPHYLPETFASRACPDRIVEAEHLRTRLLKGTPIGFEHIAEHPFLHRSFRAFDAQQARPVSFEKSCLGRIRKTRLIVRLVLCNHQPIDKQEAGGRIGEISFGG